MEIRYRSEAKKQGMVIHDGNTTENTKQVVDRLKEILDHKDFYNKLVSIRDSSALFGRMFEELSVHKQSENYGTFSFDISAPNGVMSAPVMFLYEIVKVRDLVIGIHSLGKTPKKKLEAVKYILSFEVPKPLLKRMKNIFKRQNQLQGNPERLINNEGVKIRKAIDLAYHDTTIPTGVGDFEWKGASTSKMRAIINHLDDIEARLKNFIDKATKFLDDLITIYDELRALYSPVLVLYRMEEEE